MLESSTRGCPDELLETLQLMVISSPGMISLVATADMTKSLEVKRGKALEQSATLDFSEKCWLRDLLGITSVVHPLCSVSHSSRVENRKT